MVLTNKQRGKLVLDLYNEGKTIKEMAKEAKMSFRDIGVILKEAGKQEEQTQMQSISSKAYGILCCILQTLIDALGHLLSSYASCIS